MLADEMVVHVIMPTLTATFYLGTFALPAISSTDYDHLLLICCSKALFVSSIMMIPHHYGESGPYPSGLMTLSTKARSPSKC